MRTRLFLILTSATLAVWLCAVLWIEHSTRAQFQRVLDARLVEAARMVASLVARDQIALNADAPARLPLPLPVPASPTLSSLPAPQGYEHQQFCQIWSFSGQLVGRSQGAPQDRLVTGSAAGFRDIYNDGRWLRVYTIADPALGGQVTVGDSLEMRNRLVRDVIAGLLWPAGVILPLMWGLIWLAIARGLAPLERFARELAARPAEDLRALPPPPRPRPREIRPLAQALDALLARLQTARARERDFIACAAHELKTPLAGLRTQADVARRAPDEASRTHALHAIESAVARTDRMVRQLLDLARIEHHSPPAGALDLAGLLRQTLGELAELADRHQVQLALELPEPLAPLRGDPFLLRIALRNLVENAIQASPTGGQVLACLRPQAAWLSLDIRDDGPGLPAAIAARAHEKFVKGHEGDQSGSGLGLAIATDALHALGGQIGFHHDGAHHHCVVRLPLANPDRLSP